MKIVLLGYMASGKSTIGKVLAKNLSVRFIDLDTYIEEKENSSIVSIFKEKGEIYFRKIESIYLKEILVSDTQFVLSLGGGTPCYASNIEFINSINSISIYLKLPIKTLAERLLKEKENRPLIADLSEDGITEFVAKHLFERRLYYEQAKVQLSIDNTTSVDDIVLKIKNIL